MRWMHWPSRAGTCSGLSARGRLRGLQLRRAGYPLSRSIGDSAIIAALLAMLLATGLPTPPTAQAMPERGISPSASCAALAAVDRSATNNPGWGMTILAGHNAPGGWFGVNVCSNGINPAAENGADVSCDALPSNWAKTSCAPGHPTNDGYGWTFQCVELAIRFSAWAFNDAPWNWGRAGGGNAPDLWLPGNHPSDFVAYANGSRTPPVPGDLLVWGSLADNGQPWPAGPDGMHGGHIAVVAAVRHGMVITAEENVKWGTQDHPTDTLALTDVGGHWILSGTTQHTTTLPTYRWPRTMGTTRATYGWLHSIKNTGQFPSQKSSIRVVPPTSQGATPTPTPAPAASPSPQTSEVLPSLAPATVVTSGTLTDLLWRKDAAANASAGATPQADARSLGTPPGVLLAAEQTPATVVLPDGTRSTYVLGSDGALYVATTAPATLGVTWRRLGWPGGVKLAGSPSATLFAGGVAVAARGRDGNLWWRAGPPDALGAWLMAGRPQGITLSTHFAMVAAPGSGAPLLLALGTNGVLYQSLWQDADTEGIDAGWGGWTSLDHLFAWATLSGALVVVPDLPQGHDMVGPWPDAPLNIFVRDTLGRIWRMRTAQMTAGWRYARVIAPAGVKALLAGTSVAIPAPPSTASASVGEPLVHLYVDVRGTKDPGQVMLATLHPDLARNDNLAATWAPLGTDTLSGRPVTGGVAVPLNTASVLVTPNGKRVHVFGTGFAVLGLLPSGESGSADVPAAMSTDVSVPTLANGGTFDDLLTGTVVDPRWALVGDGAQAQASSVGLALPSSMGLALLPGNAGTVRLLQQAAPGNATVSVRVRFPAGENSAQAGLVLYLDDGNQLTLLAQRTGIVTLCAVIEQQARQCATPLALRLAPSADVMLRVRREGDAFSGAASADGATWQTVGYWEPDGAHTLSATTATSSPQPMPESSTTQTPVAAALTGPETAVASLAYPSWGLVSQGATAGQSAPLFTDFAVRSASTSVLP